MKVIERFIIPGLILLIIIGIVILLAVNGSIFSVNWENFSQKTATVYTGCTVYDIWKEYGGNSKWDDYACKVQNLNKCNIGDIKAGEEIKILVYEGE